MGSKVFPFIGISVHADYNALSGIHIRFAHVCVMDTINPARMELLERRLLVQSGQKRKGAHNPRRIHTEHSLGSQARSRATGLGPV